MKKKIVQRKENKTNRVADWRRSYSLVLFSYSSNTEQLLHVWNWQNRCYSPWKWRKKYVNQHCRTWCWIVNDDQTKEFDRLTLKILSATIKPAWCATLCGWTSQMNNPCLSPPANRIPILVESVKNETKRVPLLNDLDGLIVVVVAGRSKW